MTSERCVFTLGDLSHQPNCREFREVIRMANVPMSSSELPTPQAQKRKAREGGDSVVARFTGYMYVLNWTWGLHLRIYAFAHSVGSHHHGGTPPFPGDALASPSPTS